MGKSLENAGHTLLYLPPYSPEFNPIKHKWGQMKALKRTIEGIYGEIQVIMIH
jgi:transposase